jgi:cell division septation protein DedD
MAPLPSVPPARRALTPPAPPEPPPPAVEVVLVAAPARQCKGRFIQVGAFAEPEHAWQAAARLYGLAAAPVSTQRLTSDPLLRVRLGPIDDPRSAAVALDQLKRSGYGGAFIVGGPTGMATPC